MKHKRYEKIGEDLYFGQLRNGLNVNVVTKPGFRLSYAVFATNYGGAHRRFSLGGKMHATPAGVAHFLEHKMFDMPDGAERAFGKRRSAERLHLKRHDRVLFRLHLGL